MLTDWVLISRLARELAQRLRGARVDDAGMLDDGRIALLLRLRGARLLLAVDLFTSPPVVTLEDGELGIGVEPGFVRVLARSLRGMLLDDVTARREDRLLRLSFTARSRFGVSERLELYVELVPRFGNIVLVKDGTIVGAYKEFTPAQNLRRAVQAGMPYEFPPLPAHPRTLANPPPGSVLDLFAEFRAQEAARVRSEQIAARRRALLRRLSEREQRLRTELASLAEKRSSAARRDDLRAQGNAIFATLHELRESERDSAKERAAELFAQYKKLGKRLPHLDARERAVIESLESLDALRWEAERAADDDLDAVASVVVSSVEGRPQRSIAPPKRRRPLLEFRTSGGSRILVGRSPLENAELTFRVARPNDLWFHAQRIPGAHVILARDDRSPASADDIEQAAALAAYHSRAKDASAVSVDYTLRKHVRKQRSAPPGLVWYTHAQTIVVPPKPAVDPVVSEGVT
jgi:predicted ribosome quality control (RQC) complex YloA/Tae2 family protein